MTKNPSRLSSVLPDKDSSSCPPMAVGRRSGPPASGPKTVLRSLRAKDLLGLGLVVASLACGGCLFNVGTRGAGEIVEARGTDLADAQKNAVASFLGLYVSPATLASRQDVIEEKVLARAAFFIRKTKVREKDDRGVLIRALVLHTILGNELERLGLSAPAGKSGRRKVLISLTEEGASCRRCPAAGLPGSADKDMCREEGCAAGTLRLALIRRGFSVWDLPDLVRGADQVPSQAPSPSGVADDLLEKTRKLGADILVQGRVRAESRPDERLKGYHRYVAAAAISAVELDAARGSGGAEISEQAEATAVDLTETGAATKALENAGEIAGDALAVSMNSSWKVDTEVVVGVVGLSELSDAKGVIEAIRAVPAVRSAVLASFAPPEMRLRVLSRQDPAALAASLMAMSSYRFHALAVGSGMLELELLSGPGGKRIR